MVMMLLEMAKEIQPDWRILGIRAALWDTLREVTTTDPTGVPWAVGLNQDHIKVLVNTDEIEAWNFQAAFVTLQYAENTLHTSGRGVPVGGARPEDPAQVWQLSDA